MFGAGHDHLDRDDGVFAYGTVAANASHKDWRYGIDTSLYEYVTPGYAGRDPRIDRF
jgi:hypothetical protein